jgi:hypothetical protein
MQGFLVTDFAGQFLEGLMTLSDWAHQGKILTQIDVQEGFENIPTTLDRLFAGANNGKQVLKLSDPPLPSSATVVEKVVMKVIGSYYTCQRISWVPPLAAAIAAICMFALKAKRL